METLKDKIFDSPIILKTSPTAFLYGGIFYFTAEYRFMVEVTTGRTNSDALGISVLGKSILFKLIEKSNNITTIDVAKVSGWKLQYVHKFFLIPRKKHAPSGFFFGPLIQYTNAHISEGLARYYTHTYFEFHNLNANLIIGVQTAHKNRLSFEVYAGLGYKTNTLYYRATTYKYAQIDAKKYFDYPPYLTHLNAVFGINMGYAF